MALKFLEGCELYGGFSGLPSSFQRKWGAVTQYYSINVGQTGRTPGTYALSLASDWYYNGDNITTPAFTARDEWVVGFAYKRQTTSINGNILRAYSGTGIVQLELRQSGNTITLTRGAAGTLLHTWFVVTNDTNWHHIQLKFKISPTAGYAQLFYDGVNRGTSATNLNTQNSAPATVDRIMFLAPSGSGTTGYNSIACYFDDIYICDTTGTTNNDFLGDRIIEGIVPNSEGSFTQLQLINAANNWDAVADPQVSDETDYVRARFSGIKDSYNFTNLTNIISDVKGVQINIDAKNSGAGNVNFTPIIRTASTNYDLTEQTLSSSTIAEVSRFPITEINPNTNQQWSVSNINNVQFGIRTTAQSETPVWVTTTLPNAGKNTAYNASLIATNDATYSVTSGSLPDGMSLNSATGLISGTNTTISATTTFTFTVEATNGFGSASRQFTIVVIIPFEAQIFAWGAGGSGGSRGGWSAGAVGGAGGAANATFNIYSSLDVVVGGGGVPNSTSLTVGGGGIASRNGADNQYGGGGGGYSGVFTSFDPSNRFITSSTRFDALIIAGGGGGGGVRAYNVNENVGGAGGGLVGQDGASPIIAGYQGRGGTQTAPGENSLTDSITNNGFQAALLGGSPRANSYGGAGGGGYFGGSAGGYYNVGQMGGGGGGSGFIHPSGVSGTLTAGVGTTPGDNANSLRNGAGAAGTGSTTPGAGSGAGTNGRVVFKYLLPQKAWGGTVTDDGTHVYHTFSTAGISRFAMISEPPVWATSTSLPNAQINAAYSQSLISSGVTYSVTSGSLPTGMSLNSRGVISGTNTTVTSDTLFTFTVTATNAFGSASRQFTINVEYLPALGGESNWWFPSVRPSGQEHVSIIGGASIPTGAIGSVAGKKTISGGRNVPITAPSGNNWTFSAWILFQTGVGDYNSLYYGNSAANGIGLLFNLSNAGNVNLLRGGISFGTSYGLTNNSFNHYVLRNSGGTVTVWINGVQRLTGSGFSSPNPNNSFFISNQTDDIRYFNRAITDSEISILANIARGNAS